MEPTNHILPGDAFHTLLEVLQKQGYQVIGPTVRDKAIMYDELEDVRDLPRGYVDEMDGGHYRITRTESPALFGYVIGPDSWKKFLHPPRQQIFSCSTEEKEWQLHAQDPAADAPMAFIGMRACELHAIAVQDKVFLDPRFTDPGYANRRSRAFFVAVNCTRASATCFCTSMQTGPKVDLPVDLNLIELIDDDRHEFMIEARSDRGAAVLAELPTSPAPEETLAEADRRVDEAGKQMGRSMNTDGLKTLLYENLEHPRWEAVAERCLGCTNCTMVCPTCFCTTVEDLTDIPGTTAERVRRWDSCFTWDFSYMHGGSLRKTGKSRYRQWMTHKLASWHDQFDSSGCVGCGRCIAWCPVGIDITEEVQAIQNQPTAEAPHGNA